MKGAKGAGKAERWGGGKDDDQDWYSCGDNINGKTSAPLKNHHPRLHFFSFNVNKNSCYQGGMHDCFFSSTSPLILLGEKYI